MENEVEEAQTTMSLTNENLVASALSANSSIYEMGKIMIIKGSLSKDTQSLLKNVMAAVGKGGKSTVEEKRATIRCFCKCACICG
jgi:hypothetical protein